MALVELRPLLPDAIFDLRYGTTNNVLGKAYPDYPALLEESAAMALVEVSREIGKKSLTLVIWDAWRPQEVHDALMEKHPDPKDVNPDSPHLWGGAVDLTFGYKSGGLMDMGTDFDEFGPKAHGDYLGLTVVQRHNRPFLDQMMSKHDFVRWPSEWWHYGFRSLLQPPD